MRHKGVDEVLLIYVGGHRGVLVIASNKRLKVRLMMTSNTYV